MRLKSDAPRRMSKIVWIDMEMTGLNVRKDKIMEIACIITNNNLDILAEHPTIVIHQPDNLLNSMDEWCTTTHTKVRIQEYFERILCFNQIETIELLSFFL